MIPFFARTVPPDQLQSNALVSFVRRLKFTRLGIVYCEDAYCEGLRQNVIHNLDSSRDPPLLFSINVNRRALQSPKTAQAAVESVRAGLESNCDEADAVHESAVVLLLLHDYDAERLMQIEGASSLPAILIGSESVGSNPSNPAVSMSGMLALRLTSEDSERRRRLAMQLPGIEQEIFALMSYDAVWALAHAMHAHLLAMPTDAGFANSTRIMQHLASVNFSGVTGSVLLDRNLERSNVGYDIIMFEPNVDEVTVVAQWEPSASTLTFASEFKEGLQTLKRYPCALNEERTILVSPLLASVLSATGMMIVAIAIIVTLKCRQYKQLRTKRYLSFLSHHQHHAERAALELYHALSKHRRCHRLMCCDGRRHFLDKKETATGDFARLQDLPTLVRMTEVLVIIQSREVFQRPYCLVEVFTAIIEKIPIVPVFLDYLDATKQREAGYDFEEQKEYMRDFETQLVAKNPSAASELLEILTNEYPDHGLTLSILGQKLHDVVPKAVSHRYTVDTSERERTAQIREILDAVSSATNQDSHQRMTFWRTARAVARAIPRLIRSKRTRISALPMDQLRTGTYAAQSTSGSSLTLERSSSEPSQRVKELLKSNPMSPSLFAAKGELWPSKTGALPPIGTTNTTPTTQPNVVRSS
eukprot:SAG31_NODE_1670_length_7567_cov_13.084360_2_plen_645_part_00